MPKLKSAEVWRVNKQDRTIEYLVTLHLCDSNGSFELRYRSSFKS
mgnify:CR=1 FL=1